MKKFDISHLQRKYIFLFGSILVLAIITAGLLLSDKKYDYFSLLNFQINDEGTPLNIRLDEDTDTYYLFLPSYADSSNVEILLNDSYSLQIGSDKLHNGDCIDYTLNKKYEMHILNSEDQAIQSGSIVCMRSENVSAMFVVTKSGNTDFINADKGNKESANMTLINQGGGLEHDGELLFIKGRGNLTWASEKKPYNIRLSEADDLLGMGQAQDWCLLSNYYDASNIRNALVYGFAEDIGLSYVPEYEFVDLYLNGEYAGLYQLCEKVEINKSRIDIYNLEEETRRVNLRALETYGTVETDKFKYQNINNNPEDIARGYLIQLDFSGFYIDEPSWIITDRNQPFAISSPEYVSKEQLTYIKGFLSEFEEALYSDSGVNSKGKSYLDYIDLDSWAKKYLLDEVFVNQDVEWSSEYFYLSELDGDIKLFAGPPWDYDGALGNYDASGNVVCLNPKALISLWRGEYDADYQSWYSELYQKDAFYSEVTRLYGNTLKPYLSELLLSGMEKYASGINASALMNQIRWYGGEDIKGAQSAIDDALDYAEGYLSDRVGFLDSLWIDNTPYYTVSFNGLQDNLYYKYSVRSGQRIEEVPLPLEPDGFAGWYYKDTDIPFDQHAAITKDTELSAKWSLSLLSWARRYYLIVPIIIVVLLVIVLVARNITRGLKTNVRRHR